MGMPHVDVRGSWNQATWSLQWAITTRWSSTLKPYFTDPCATVDSRFRGPCIGWSMAVDPLSATAVPLHLTHFAVPFVQIVATVCLQGTWFYTIFYDMYNAWYMVFEPWVDLIRHSLNKSERLPTPPFDWGKLVYSVANQKPRLMRPVLSK